MITNPVFIDLVSAITPKPRIVCEYCIVRNARIEIKMWDIDNISERKLKTCYSCHDKAVDEGRKRHNYTYKGFTYL